MSLLFKSGGVHRQGLEVVTDTAHSDPDRCWWCEGRHVRKRQTALVGRYCPDWIEFKKAVDRAYDRLFPRKVKASGKAHGRRMPA